MQIQAEEQFLGTLFNDIKEKVTPWCNKYITSPPPDTNWLWDLSSLTYIAPLSVAHAIRQDPVISMELFPFRSNFSFSNK